LYATKFLPIALRENSIVTDPDKPFRQYVLREKIQECIDALGLDPMLSAISIVLVIVRDCAISHVQDPGVSDCHTIGIASDVFKNLADSLGGRL
jgi:hypothetical protein